MPSKTSKSEGAVVKAANTKPQPKVAVRRKVSVASAAVEVSRKKVPVANRKSNPVISTEAIALRAYFIAENRRMTGTPGDQLGDWIEAERQLLLEQQTK
jgi:hypothetical protein